MLLHQDQPFLLSMVSKCPILHTPTDWKETAEAHVFVSDVPGLTKDQVSVDIVAEDGHQVLQISGDRGDDDHQKLESSGGGGEKWRRVERFRGKFVRRFRLPEDANADGVTAAMENGVLTVRVPKKEVKKPERKIVQIQGPN